MLLAGVTNGCPFRTRLQVVYHGQTLILSTLKVVKEEAGVAERGGAGVAALKP